MSKFCTWIGLLIAILPAAGFPQALPGTESEAQAEAHAWTWFGDVMLRGDRVTGIPRPVDPSFTRYFGRGRFGVLFDPIPALQFGAAIKLADASNPNSDDRKDNRNERSNDAALDQLFIRWSFSETGSLLFGKTEFPLQLSPLLWDQDLRPIGASANLSASVGEFDRLQFIGGYFAGNLMYGDDSRIAALQGAYHWHEGAAVNGSVVVSYLDFSSLRQLTVQGLSRTNRRVGPVLVSDYRLFDLQLVGRAQVWNKPLEVRLDLVRNLGADDQRDGGRISAVLGDSRQAQGWEFGLAGQRLGRDAAMAAFNSDDWWFHSWARGIMPWVAYGFDAVWSARLAAFHERRDGVDQYTDRVLVDLYARW